MSGRRWPATLTEFEALEAKALDKYRPLVARLQPWEHTALAKALREAGEQLRRDAHVEDARREARKGAA